MYTLLQFYHALLKCTLNAPLSNDHLLGVLDQAILILPDAKQPKERSLYLKIKKLFAILRSKIQQEQHVLQKELWQFQYSRAANIKYMQLRISED